MSPFVRILHTEPCSDCGVPVKTRRSGGSAPLCDGCRRAHRLQQLRNYRKATQHYNCREREQLTEKAYQVISDPEPEYGFNPGATFSEVEHQAMLKNRSYTPGTVLIDTDGNRYKIRDARPVQKLEALL